MLRPKSSKERLGGERVGPLDWAQKQSGPEQGCARPNGLGHITDRATSWSGSKLRTPKIAHLKLSPAFVYSPLTNKRAASNGSKHSHGNSGVETRSLQRPSLAQRGGESKSERGIHQRGGEYTK